MYVGRKSEDKAPLVKPQIKSDGCCFMHRLSPAEWEAAVLWWPLRGQDPCQLDIKMDVESQVVVARSTYPST